MNTVKDLVAIFATLAAIAWEDAKQRHRKGGVKRQRVLIENGDALGYRLVPAGEPDYLIVPLPLSEQDLPDASAWDTFEREINYAN